MTTLVPNTEFAHLASDEDIATVVTALTAKGMAASVVENRAEARSRVLDLLPEGAEVYTALSQTLEVLSLREEISTSSRYVPLRPQIDKLGREGRMSRAGRKLMACSSRRNQATKNPTPDHSGAVWRCCGCPSFSCWRC